jgi:hypothetical protein
MKTNDINTLIFNGDHVLDNMDNTVRQVSEIQDHGDGTASVYMADGGVMDLAEIQFDDIRLESEVDEDEEHDRFVDACYNADYDRSMML